MRDWASVNSCINCGLAFEFANTLERSEYNRDMVKNKWYITGYIQIEEYIKHLPKRYPLPSWITPGGIPSLDRRLS